MNSWNIPLLLLFAFFFSPVMCAETTLPADAVKLMTGYTQDVDKIEQERDIALIKITDKFRKNLSRCMESATKKGDLEVALALKQEIANLDAQFDIIGRRIEARLPRTPTWLDGYQWQIVWSGSRNFVDFADDGTMRNSDGNTGTFTVSKDDGSVIMEWSDGKVWTATQPATSSPDKTAGRNHAGTTFSMNKER